MKTIRLGFTLIELVAVMLLIAILSVALIPSFNNNSYQAYLFADQLLNTLRYARQLAVDSGCPVQAVVSSSFVTLNQGTGGVGFPASAAACGGIGATFSVAVTEPVTGNSGYSLSPPSGITLSTATITLDPWGRAWNSGLTACTSQQSITITGNGETLYTVYIEGPSGYAHL